MTNDQFRKTQLDIRDGLALIARRKLRDMRRRTARPRTHHLPKEARVLKSLLAEARAAGLVPPGASPSAAARRWTRTSPSRP